MTPMETPDPFAEIARLQARNGKLAEEKANLQLVVSLIEHLNPLSGLEDMMRAMIYSIVEAIGGTNIKLYYWIDEELHYIDFLGGSRTLEAIDDALVREVVRRREFIEQAMTSEDGLMRGEVVPGAWTWTFPLLVGQELIGVIKLENLHIPSALLRNYLAVFFSHVALILSNEIRNQVRRRIEAALFKKTEELDNYFNNALDLFCIADTQGYFHKLNPEWAHALGYTLAELEGHRFLDFVHPDDLQATLDAVSALSEQNPVLNFVNRYRHQDGSYRWIEWRARPSGNMIFAAAHDITERKQASDALARSHAELQRFAEVTAHHLQEPARRMASYAERLTRQLAGRLNDAEAALSLEYIGQQARRQQNLLRDVERYLEADQPRGEIADVDVRALVAGLLAAMSVPIGQAGAEITLGDLPPARLDAPRLKDLFAVTLENALYHGRSERALRIAITGERNGNRVRYGVSDNGPGMEAEYRERVFRVFERLSTTSDGTGIGLAILRRVAESAGGRAWIAETPGGGCSVLFELPAGESG